MYDVIYYHVNNNKFWVLLRDVDHAKFYTWNPANHTPMVCLWTLIIAIVGNNECVSCFYSRSYQIFMSFHVCEVYNIHGN